MIKHFVSIDDLSFEAKNNQIPIAGRHSILSALNNKNRKLHYLITTNNNLSKWNDELNKLQLKLDIEIITKEEMDKINNYKPHQNAILVTEPLQRISLDEFLHNHISNNKIPIRLILLDEVTDPQNVGAIIRSALAFKMNGLALSQRNSPQETSALNKASSGAIEKLQIIELSNMSREIKKLQKGKYPTPTLRKRQKKRPRRRRRRRKKKHEGTHKNP